MPRNVDDEVHGEVRRDEKDSVLQELIAAENLRDAALRVGLRHSEVVMNKYKKSSRIVEEGLISVKIELDEGGANYPLVEVSVDGVLLGYINDRHRNNIATFKIECVKRGSGRWDKRKLVARPVREWTRYFRPTAKVVRLAAIAQRSSIALYLPLKPRRNVLGIRRSMPKSLVNPRPAPA